MTKSSRAAPIKMLRELGAMEKLSTERLREIAESKRAGKHRRRRAQELLHERGDHE